MGLISLLTADVTDSSQNVIQHPSRCLRKRLNTNQCDLCVKACPSAAISIEGREVTLDEVKCSDCMSCVAMCPQDVFESCVELSDGILGAITGSHSFITCFRQQKSSNEDVAVPCVGIFSLQAIAYLLFSSSSSISINLSACGECCNHAVADSFTQRFYALNNYFQDHKTTEVNVIFQGNQVHHIPCDRRAYLSNLANFAARFTANSLIGAGSDSSQIKKERRRVPIKVKLVNTLLEKTEKEALEMITKLFHPELAISAECNVCPLCKGICPTGALRIDRRKTDKILKFNAFDCSSCGLCVEFCKKKAITLKQERKNRILGSSPKEM